VDLFGTNAVPTFQIEVDAAGHITSIKEKEEVLDKIKEFKCDREKINKWVEDVVSGEA
jgi:hypothetical protein